MLPKKVRRKSPLHAGLLVSRLHGKQPEPELTAVRWRCTVHPICPLLEPGEDAGRAIPHVVVVGAAVCPNPPPQSPM